MIDIALLGGVSVSVDGKQLSGEAAQRRRVAVLVLLASPALRPVSRDRLIGWLWPDHDPESARHLLSAALHVLRKALGPDALVTTGDDVALNPAVVRVDAAAFRESVAEDDLERALSLYRGEFLDGFFVNDAADFSQWVDGERDALKRLFGDTLERAAAARAQAGSLAGAAEAWRRRAALDPYDARVALELMRALAAAGQRPAAIQHARLHAQLVEQEFGAEPDRQVEALAEALRQAPADPPVRTAAGPAGATAGPAGTAAVPAPGPTGAATEPAGTATVPQTGVAPAAPGVGSAKVVPAPAMPAVAPAAASSSPALPTPAAAGPVPPVQPPAGSRPLRSRARRRFTKRVIGYAGTGALIFVAWLGVRELIFPRPPGVPCTAGAACTIAVRAFVSDEDTLSARALALAEDAYVELGRFENVSMVARDVAFATAGLDSRAALASLAQIGVPADATFGGKLYSDHGMLHVHLELVNGEGINLVPEALSADGERALVDSMVSKVAAVLGRQAPPAPVAEIEGGSHSAAEESRDLQAYRHYLNGRTAWLKRTPESLSTARAEYQAAVALDSQYARAWAGLADAYTMLGSYEDAGLAPREAYPRARAAAQRAILLDDSLADAWGALANTQANYDWDWKSAEANYKKAIDLAGGHSSASEWLALLLAARRRTDEADRETLAAVELQPNVPLTWVNRAHVLYYARRYAEADSALEQALMRDSSFLRAHLLRAMVALAAGQAPAVLPRLASFRSASNQPEPPLLALLGYAQAKAGQPDSARAQLRLLADIGRRQYVPPELRALVHVALGEHDAAMRELLRAFDDHSSGMVYLQVEPLLEPLYQDPRYRQLVARLH